MPCPRLWQSGALMHSLSEVEEGFWSLFCPRVVPAVPAVLVVLTVLVVQVVLEVLLVLAERGDLHNGQRAA